MSRVEAFLLSTSSGERFCLFHNAEDRSGLLGAIVYVHPFAEEMNKSRRMAALQSRALAEAGFAVLQIDLHGCGDSAGEFADATWSGWVDDVVAAATWARERTGCAPSLWGLRAGCLIAGEAAGRIADVSQLLYWQPVHSGSQHLQQFLRLRVAGQLVGALAGERVGTAELRAQLASGASLDVAGYQLSPAVATGLDTASLAKIPASVRVALLEVSANDPPELLPASQVQVDRWRAAGHDVVAQAVRGLAFWATQEIAECAALIAATRAVAFHLRR